MFWRQIWSKARFFVSEMSAVSVRVASHKTRRLMWQEARDDERWRENRAHARDKKKKRKDSARTAASGSRRAAAARNHARARSDARRSHGRRHRRRRRCTRRLAVAPALLVAGGAPPLLRRRWCEGRNLANCQAKSETHALASLHTRFVYRRNRWTAASECL